MALDNNATELRCEAQRSTSPRVRCSLATEPSEPAIRDAHQELSVEGCPLADLLEERLQFERLLVEMSLVFVDLPIHEIDAQISENLRRLGEALNVDRMSFAEFTDDEPDMIVRYSYVADGIAPFPPVIVDGTLPWYAEQIRRGKCLRFSHLPDDAPPEAAAEREYCIREGLKSNLAIPLRVSETVGCVLTFATFHSYRQWPDDLVQRLWLVGQIFANSLARKRSEEKTRNLQHQLALMGRVALVGEMAAAIAHEIKQPLCAIVSNAQAGQRLSGAENVDLGELREILSDVAHDAHRANEVVERVRHMLQQKTIERSPVDLNAAIREVVELLHVQLNEHRISLEVDLPSELPLVHGDQIQLQQVVLNLALNAIDAMKQEVGAARRLSIQGARRDIDEIVVSVCDSGPGIATDIADSVFTAFFTTKPDGMGVGLAICRSIIESHGGNIWVENTANGAAFHFTVPVAAVTKEGSPGIHEARS